MVSKEVIELPAAVVSTLAPAAMVITMAGHGERIFAMAAPALDSIGISTAETTPLTLRFAETTKAPSDHNRWKEADSPAGQAEKSSKTPSVDVSSMLLTASTAMHPHPRIHHRHGVGRPI